MVTTHDERCSIVAHSRAASACLPIGQHQYVVQSLIESLNIVTTKANGAPASTSHAIKNTNEFSTRVTAMARHKSMANTLVCGTVNGEINEYDTTTGLPRQNGCSLLGTSALNEPVFRLFTINTTATGNSDVVVVVGIHGAVAVMANQRDVLKTTLPNANSSTSSVVSMDVLVKKKDNSIHLCYVLSCPSYALYTTEVTDVVCRCCDGNRTATTAVAKMGPPLLESVHVPVVGVLTVAVCDQHLYFLDVKHRMYVMDMAHASDAATVTTGKEPVPETGNILQSLLTNIGRVKTQRYQLLTDCMLLDAQLQEMSQALQWYLRSVAISKRDQQATPQQGTPLSPLGCTVRLLPSGSHSTLAAITGKYTLRVTLSGLANNNNTQSGGGSGGASSALPPHLAHVLPFPHSEQWRAVVQLRQQSCDGSIHTTCHTVPLCHMLSSSELNDNAFNHSNLSVQFVDIDVRRMVSMDAMHVTVDVVYSPGNNSGGGGGGGMCVPLSTTAFDLLDTCVPSSSRASMTSSATKTVDELNRSMRDGVRNQLSSKSDTEAASSGLAFSSSSLGLGTSRSARSSSSAAAAALTGMFIKHDVTSIVPHLFEQRQNEERLAADKKKGGDGGGGGGGSSSSSSSSSSNNHNSQDDDDDDRNICGRLIATLLGNTDGYRWEKSISPGYVASHGMLWGGHRITLVSRFVRETHSNRGESSGNGSGDEKIWLEIRITCTDSTRLSMLRSCVMQRIVQLLNSGFVEEREATATNTTLKMTMHKDQTLRSVEDTLSKCLLRLFDVSKVLRGGGGDGRQIDMIQLMSEMKTIMDQVVLSYNMLRY